MGKWTERAAIPGPGAQVSGPAIQSSDEEADNLRVTEAESRATGRRRKNNRMWFRVALSLVCLAALASTIGMGPNSSRLTPGRGRAGPTGASRGTGAHANLACNDCHRRHREVQGAAPGGTTRLVEWSTQYTEDGLATFTLYSSPTFDAPRTDISQPDGPSKLCLGCHDGSYSMLSDLGNRNLVFDTESLTRTHPISFTYDSALAARARWYGLRDPASTPSGLGGTIQRDLLDANSKMQCTSCHDPHPAARGPKLLRYPASSGANTFCRVCHDR